MTLLWQFLSRVNIHFEGLRCRVLFPFQEGFLARVSDIKKHEKRIKETNKCNLCEYASSNAGFIRRHMKKKTNVTSAIIHCCVSRNTKTLTGSKRQTSAISVSMHLPVLAS